jgi:transcriptional regulator with XRE-family HTH domain
MFHYGQIIREYRQLANMTISELAGKWPNRELGVTPRYVSDVERGIKHISDISTLRELSELLTIPLWKLGLSAYNPFSDEIEANSDLFEYNTLEQLIDDIWFLRLNMSFDFTKQKVDSLHKTFSNLMHRYSLLTNKDFLRLYAQELRLQELVCTEEKNYDLSFQHATSMLEVAKQSGDNKTIALSYIRIGCEHLRQEKYIDAVANLKHAIDMSLHDSRELASYALCYLARVYAELKDERMFNENVDKAINLGSGMQSMPLCSKDFVYYNYSAILEERSNGLIQLGKSKEVVEVLDEIQEQINVENNGYLKIWLPLDYAQACLNGKNIDQSIYYLKNFYKDAQAYKSQRLMSKIQIHIEDMQIRGYGSERVVQEFQEEISF